MEHPFLILIELFKLLGMQHVAEIAAKYVHVVYAWVVMGLLIFLGYIGTRNISMVPNKLQNVLELLVSSVEEFMVTVTGDEGRAFFPFAATIFIFIFASNLIGSVPGFYTPTANLNTTLACAIIVFIYTHYLGIKFHGAHYVKHFLGPVWWMVPLILPIEIISHLARVLSLSFRLFGNMLGHELVLGILFMLAGAFFAPLPIMALGLFVAFVQAFIFFLLSIMYFAGAMEEAH